MLPKEVPVWAKELLDERAGKEHSVNGPVMQALAEILTPYQTALDTIQEMVVAVLEGRTSNYDSYSLADDVLTVIEEMP